MLTYRDKLTEMVGDTLSGVSPFAAAAGGRGSIRPQFRPRASPHRTSGGTICNFTWRSCRGWL